MDQDRIYKARDPQALWQTRLDPKQHYPGVGPLVSNVSLIERPGHGEPAMAGQ